MLIILSYFKIQNRQPWNNSGFFRLYGIIIVAGTGPSVLFIFFNSVYFRNENDLVESFKEMSEEEMAQHLKLCMKLSAENVSYYYSLNVSICLLQCGYHCYFNVINF